MFAIRLLLRNRGRFAARRLSKSATAVDANGSSQRAKDAVAAMIKRLAHRNANVQLYTLEVCGPCGRGIITFGV